MVETKPLLERFVDRVTGALAGASVGKEEMMTALHAAHDAVYQSKEGVVELELASEDLGWDNITSGGNNWNVSHDFVLKLTKLSRLMYLMNPLIKRAVTVQELYVWGSGYTIKAKSEKIQEVLDDFFKHPKNQDVVGDAFDIREREQRIDGNTFLVFFRNKSNGAARVRRIPIEQITEIIPNPEDSCDIWYYKRAVPTQSGSKYELYPCILYTPRAKPAKYLNMDVNWDEPILHIKTGGLSDMKYGLPELWSAIPWATAYKKILENFATILSAYARLAMKISGTGGKKGIAAAKSQLNTKLNTSSTTDTNPPPNTASWWLASGGMDVAPVKTANSTTGPDEARALRSMVASGSDTPEHFFGDSDIGNFATSTTLDRPTELKMISRQDMWRKIVLKVSAKLIEWSSAAPNGKLKQAGFKAKYVKDFFDPTCTEVTIVAPDKESTNVTMIFPTILSRDVIDRVRSVVMAATLNGSPAEGIIKDRRQLYQMLMTALDEEDVENLVKTYYPEMLEQGFIDPKDKLKNDTLTAQGRADLGQAALDQAAAAKQVAKNPPKPVKNNAAN